MNNQQFMTTDIYGRPVINQMPMYQPVQQTPAQIAKVHGQSGAEEYPLAPNSEILILDLDEPKVWMKKTDATGYTVQLQSYDIVVPEDPQQTTLDSFDARIKRLEEAILNGNKSDSQRPKQQSGSNNRKE